jgi:hypothetical protein
MNEDNTESKTIVKGLDFNNKEVSAGEWGCVAKYSKSEPSNLERFFIRVCNDGPDNGLFYNPSVHPQSDLKRFDAFKGKRRFEFKVVNKESYDMYVQFLENKNPSLLKNAERASV